MAKYFDAVMARFLEDNFGDRKKKLTDEQYWRILKKRFYNTDYDVIMVGGIISFDPRSKAEVKGAEKLSYDEYLEVMRQSCGHIKMAFGKCYYDAQMYSFKGRISKKNNKRVLFDKIDIKGVDNKARFFVDKEEHVWVEIQGLEKYNVGDEIEFSADIYRYLKTGTGKKIDFGLTNISNVVLIDGYDLPTDEELMLQEIDRLICENCLFVEQCCGYCIANQEWVEETRKALLEFRDIQYGNE